MTDFLTTTGISHQLEEIIKQAEERLWLISPFLKVNRRIKELLEDTNRMKIDVRVIYGKNELQPEENNWLESMRSIRTSFCKDLHAKCYLNEQYALLTSMNLYEFSQVNNHEMGILVSRKEEADLYDKVYEEARRILRASEELRVTVAKVAVAEKSAADSAVKKTLRRPQPPLTAPKGGFCIRCKVALSASPTQPYCRRCYTSWKRYETKNTQRNIATSAEMNIERLY